MPKKKERLLVPREKYLTAGAHIGMTLKTASMKRFIYRVRPNGLAVLNIGTLDRRVGYAANMIANSKRVLVVCRKEVGHEPAKKFAEFLGEKPFIKRFMPGSLTNPNYKYFFEPDIAIIGDPVQDAQALKECTKMRIPVIGLCDTGNDTSGVDLVVPCNNKGKKSLSLIFWALAKEIANKRGKEFNYKLEDFGWEEGKEVIEETEEE